MIVCLLLENNYGEKYFNISPGVKIPSSAFELSLKTKVQVYVVYSIHSQYTFKSVKYK
jgi:hypothetical protein